MLETNNKMCIGTLFESGIHYVVNKLWCMGVIK